jgi:hypothetical protein
MLKYPQANKAKIIHDIPFCFLWENKGKNTYKIAVYGGGGGCFPKSKKENGEHSTQDVPLILLLKTE